MTIAHRVPIALVVTMLTASIAAGSTAASREARSFHVETAKAGTWLARVSYVQDDLGSRCSKVHLTLVDGRTRVIDAPVVLTQGNTVACPGGEYPRRSSVSFADLNGDGSPELILDLFTGGAHCCSFSQIFNLRTLPPKRLEHEWGDPGYVLTRVGSQRVLRTNDDRFSYVFTDYADSAFPLRLYAYDGRRLDDVTRRFPARIATDAKTLWRESVAARRRNGDVRGVLAAWAADETMLGRSSTARRTLLEFAARGVLDRGFDGAKGSRYVRTLWSFLAKLGYPA